MSEATKITLLTFFVLAVGGFFFYQIADSVDDSGSDGIKAVFWLAVITWAGVVLGGMVFANYKFDQTTHHDKTSVATVNKLQSKNYPELKYSNVKIKNKKLYVDKMLLADTAKDGKLIPHNNAGEALITMLKYLQDKDILRTCTGLKINVRADQTTAFYFSEKGKQKVVVKAGESNKAVVKKVNYEQ